LSTTIKDLQFLQSLASTKEREAPEASGPPMPIWPDLSAVLYAPFLDSRPFLVRPVGEIPRTVTPEECKRLGYLEEKIWLKL
jgi:hypothetical protein